jgi:hypothetical protein
MLETFWRRRRGVPIATKLDEEIWGGVLRSYGIGPQELFRFDHFRMRRHWRGDPSLFQCMRWQWDTPANHTCATAFIASNVTPANARPRPDGGYPLPHLHRCVVYWHGHKQADVMQAAHAAMVRIVNASRGWDFRLRHEKATYPADDPYCISGMRSGMATGYGDALETIRKRALARHAQAKGGMSLQQ